MRVYRARLFQNTRLLFSATWVRGNVRSVIDTGGSPVSEVNPNLFVNIRKWDNRYHDRIEDFSSYKNMGRANFGRSMLE